MRGLAFLRQARWGLAIAPPRARESSTIAEGSSLVRQETAEASAGLSGNKAVFLENDGAWVSWKKVADQQQANFPNSTELHLEKLSVTQLRQEAQQRGQKSTGSKKELIERLLSQEAPGKDHAFEPQNPHDTFPA